LLHTILDAEVRDREGDREREGERERGGERKESPVV
jgi:hypothetical protein